MMDGARAALLVTQNYRPEALGSGPFCSDVAEALAVRGWHVEVLTCRPNYPDGIVFPSYRDGSFDHQHLDGVDVLRVRTVVRPNGSAADRLAAEGSFLFQALAALLVRRRARPDVVISLCPSILSVVAGACSRRHGARHIALVHDIQSGLAKGLGMTGGSLARALRGIERLALNRCDRIVVLSEEMRRQLRDNGVRAPVQVLPIWTDTEAIRPRPPTPGWARIALYSGNFGRKQGLMQLLDLAEVLRRRDSDLKVVLRGRGSQASSIAREVARRQLANVALSDLLAPERLAEGLAEGDIHLVPQDPATADFAVPSKVYGIMAAARPFVATARPGSMLARLQRECGAFLCVPPNDAEAFADAVMELAANDAMRRELGARGRRYVKEHCTKQRSLDCLFDAIAPAD